VRSRARLALFAVLAVAVAVTVPALGASSPDSTARKALKTAKAATKRSNKAIAEAAKPGPAGAKGATGGPGTQGSAGPTGTDGADGADGQAGTDAGETDGAGATATAPASIGATDQTVLQTSITISSPRRILATATISATQIPTCRIDIGDVTGQTQSPVLTPSGGDPPRSATFTAAADKSAAQAYDVKLICRGSFTFAGGSLQAWAVGQ
jgi:hypothetical protein